MRLFQRMTAGRHAERTSAAYDSMIGFRYEATGVFGYAFYAAGEKVCAISGMVAPSAPVVICGFRLEWRGEGEIPTIMPGAVRRVFDAAQNVTVRVVYREPGLYELDMPGRGPRVTVRSSREAHSFFRDGAPIGTLTRLNGESVWTPKDNSFDMEPYWRADIPRETEPPLLLAMLAFPMLKFGP